MFRTIVARPNVIPNVVERKDGEAAVNIAVGAYVAAASVRPTKLPRSPDESPGRRINGGKPRDVYESLKLGTGRRVHVSYVRFIAYPPPPPPPSVNRRNCAGQVPVYALAPKPFV